MLKLFCDRCGVEVTDAKYRSLCVGSSLMPEGKDEDAENLEHELCVPCYDEVMSALQAAIKSHP